LASRSRRSPNKLPFGFDMMLDSGYQEGEP
jgi:hypothetical protein